MDHQRCRTCDNYALEHCSDYQACNEENPRSHDGEA